MSRFKECLGQPNLAAALAGNRLQHFEIASFELPASKWSRRNGRIEMAEAAP
jgi:hypothetical protein